MFREQDLPGFGVRVYPSGRKVFVVQTRTFGRSKRVTIGRYGPLSADRARKEGHASHRAHHKVGESPVPTNPAADASPGEQAERYQREYVAMHCKLATASHCGSVLRKHIVAALGELRVAEEAGPMDRFARIFGIAGDRP